jgi:hypothetical protein
LFHYSCPGKRQVPVPIPQLPHQEFYALVGI